MYRPVKMNIADAKPAQSTERDLVRFVAQQITPVSLTPKEIERASENNQEIVKCVSLYSHR